LAPALEARWKADLLDLGILTAYLTSRSAPPDQAADAHRQALGILAQAESLSGPSGVLHLERAAHARALGDASVADESARLAATLPSRSAWEHLAVGRAYLAAGEVGRAAAELDGALKLDPRSPWANYHRGVCSMRLNEPVEAVAAFTTCLDAAPEVAWCWYNRGLSFADAGRPNQARADFDRALLLDPGLTQTLLARAVANARSGRLADGNADLRSAEERGTPPAEVEYARAAVHLAVGNRPAALKSLRSCLAADPAHSPAQTLLNRLLEEKTGNTAP
jgi:tetratricopeptide (TPR) repeat protein